MAVLQAAHMKQRRGQSLDPPQTWALSVQQQGHNQRPVVNKLARWLWETAHYGNAFNPVSPQPAACGRLNILLRYPPGVAWNDLDHGEGFGLGADNTDNTSGH
jgi:hypothetical protein